MKKKMDQKLAKAMAVGFLVSMVVACATIPELEVRYTLPAPEHGLRGMRVSFRFEDARQGSSFLAERAREALPHFPGTIYFSVATKGGSGDRLGLFRPEEMVKEAFERRLKAMGMIVTPGSPGSGEPELHIVLNEFLLDVANRRWVATVAYEASLRKRGTVLSTQSIRAQSERLKLIGWDEANSTLSEVFSDSVNRLDFVELFRQGGIPIP